MKMPLDRFGAEEVWSLLVAIKNLTLESPEGETLHLLLGDDWEDSEVRKSMLNELRGQGFLKNLQYSDAPFRGAAFEVNRRQFDDLCQNYKEAIQERAPGGKISEKSDTRTQKIVPIKIQNIHLNEVDRLLVINSGVVSFPFNARGDKEATKTFKIVRILWPMRYEMKGHENTVKGSDFMTAANLRRVTGIASEGALEKAINRLNARFAKKGLAIEIEKVGAEKYKLVISKG